MPRFWTDMNTTERTVTLVCLPILAWLGSVWVTDQISSDSEAQTASETPGDIERWAEQLEDEYLHPMGYEDFSDAPEGTLLAEVITFSADTRGDLKAFVWGWVDPETAAEVADELAADLAPLPHAPDTVSVYHGGSDTVLATQDVPGA